LDEGREERMAALRARVQARLEGSEPSDEELVVQASALTVETPQAMEEGNDWLAMQDRDIDRWRNLAAALILVGSILGMISGVLILQGNPTNLLDSSLFNNEASVDITGLVLDEDGRGLENVSVALRDATSDAALQTTVTDRDGYFTFENIANEPHVLVVEAEGYTSVERTFTPDRVELRPVTMKTGEGTQKESEGGASTGWTLDDAVGLSSIIGGLTVITAFAGVQAAVESRRGAKYRRAQYLAGVSLLSRGLIIIGPTLILCGMIINMLARSDYDDMRED